MTESWRRSPLVLSAASGAALALAMPQFGAAWLAWLAPLGWLFLVRVPQLPGRRPYRAIWLAAFVHWLVVIHGIRLAHPLLTLGWLALACYLAFYMAAFVAVTRVVVHCWRIPLMLAAPIVWVGLEKARGHLLTGFSMGLLGHTQVRSPRLLQIADLGGAYGVSFLVMFVAACLATAATTTPAATAEPATPGASKLRPFASLLAAAAAVALALGYGQWRLGQATKLAETPNRPTLRVALVQQSIDTIFEYDPERNAATFEKYRQLTLATCRQHPDLQLVVWPESMLSANSPAFLGDERAVPEAYRDGAAAQSLTFRTKTRRLLEEMRAAATDSRPPVVLLAGSDGVDFDGPRIRVHNTALLLGDDGRIIDRYSKTHLVMFGEYIPLGERFPWLYRITPLPFGVTPGERPAAFEVAGIRLAPNVCFESTVPHLIARQVNQLTREGRSPDVLVSVTNDGWFWGAGILDMHLACGVFRAIETRRPFLIAANTGISAAIDGSGRVLEELPRRQSGAIVLNVPLDERASPYLAIGDSAAWLCLLTTLAAALHGGAVARRERRRIRGVRI